VKVKQGIAYYYLNDKLVYEHSYQGSIGNIKMFSIQFRGSGWVDWVRLYDAQDREVYFEDFDNCEKPAKVKRNL
jgi:hypothetical protein